MTRSPGQSDDVLVAVNGYDVIGKRVADAVTAMPDIELVGVADVATDWRVQTAVGKGLDLHSATSQAERTMRQAGIVPAGDLVDLLGQVDTVVDTTPKGVAAGNMARYRELGVKAVLHGGEAQGSPGIRSSRRRTMRPRWAATPPASCRVTRPASSGFSARSGTRACWPGHAVS